MDANVLLWIGQVVLAIAFVAVGYAHAFRFEQTAERPATRWMAAVGRDNMRVIGILEMLGAVGLILPAATGVLPWLAPLAGALLAILMLSALIFHVRRPGEAQNIVVNVVLGVAAALVAYGRFVVAPF
jgi:DoxX-like family